jgi:CRISPR-associated protein Csx14
MGTHSIPVELFNPGQVLACMGFLEAADVFCGPAEGGFDWKDEPRFILHVEDEASPFETVLEFLAEAKPVALAPSGWQPPKGDGAGLQATETFPTKEPDAMSLPIILRRGKTELVVSHWADGTDERNEFKLYAGNRSALKIATDMLKGAADKKGKIKTPGIAQLWNERRAELVADPLRTLCPMAGSFNFDPRGAWTALDAGYSLNDLGGPLEQKVMASPVVEMLAAIGLEHARPAEISLRLYRYAIWGGLLPLQLARAALSGQFAPVRQRRFRFPLDLSGKNKVVCYSTEET